MYILTSRLVSLPGPALPLPWYHRAPLGLMSGTPVHVALQAPRSRPFGDLLISVVDPAKWRFVSEISASKEDQPGVLADVYKLAPPLNIVFAEAVTVDSGSRHDARLVLEPFHPPLADEEVGSMVDTQVGRLTDSLSKIGFENTRGDRLHSEHDDLPWMDVGKIEFGWVQVKGWREAVDAQARAVDDADQYDLNMAVVSADTDRRILRYVFPRKGAVSVSVEHADRPGAMGEVASVLAGSDLNILSSLLRRGSAPAQKAEIVVVVEPTDGTAEAAEVEARVREALSDLPAELRARPDVSGPVDPALYPRRPHEVAARPSPPLEASIRAVQESLPPDRCPIFISRRFTDLTDAYNRRAVEELRAVLNECGCVPVEALPQPGADLAIPDDVKAKMWASKAAIVFVVAPPDDDELSAFSANLAHEWGFMQGQGKPLLPLVQKDVSDSITRNPNLQGFQLTTFTKASALKSRRPDSIAQQVRAWLELLNEVPFGFSEARITP